MKIGIISDTHGSFMAWDMAYEKILSHTELIMHAGDVLYHGARNLLPDGYDTSILADILNQLKTPMLITRGNCDSDVDQTVLDIPILSPYVLTYISGIKILLIHGDMYGEEELSSLGKKYHVNIIICGHTHIFNISKTADLCIVNPGSPSIPKGKRISTVGTIDTDRREITIFNLHTTEVVMQDTF